MKTIENYRLVSYHISIEHEITEKQHRGLHMKKFNAIFWRENRQLKNGGYETTRTMEARTLKSAENKAKKMTQGCLYGSMSPLLRIEEA